MLILIHPNVSSHADRKKNMNTPVIHPLVDQPFEAKISTASHATLLIVSHNRP